MPWRTSNATILPGRKWFPRQLPPSSKNANFLATPPKTEKASELMKQGLVLDKVVLLGRTFEEYVRYFALDRSRLAGKTILDVPSGVSSFCAEARQQGLEVTACDLIYDL